MLPCVSNNDQTRDKCGNKGKTRGNRRDEMNGVKKDDVYCTRSLQGVAGVLRQMRGEIDVL